MKGFRQAAVSKPKESQLLKYKTPPDDAIPSTSGAATQTHPAKEKKTDTKQKHGDDDVIADDVRKDPDYQPGGDDEGEEEGGAEQVVEVVDEYDDAPTGVHGRQLAEEISDVHGTKESV